MREPNFAESATLRRWMSSAHNSEYAGGLSNHLPMALLALHRLGAPEARLESFAQTYARRLEPAPATQRWPAGDAWASRLGDPLAWPAYRDLFAQWMAAEGAGDLLEQVLPTLMQGCGGAAFHGLIRTAYAVQLAHRQELVDALAYWACRWLSLGPLANNSAGESDPAMVLIGVPVPRSAPAGELIFQRMQAIAAQPGFAPAVARLHITPCTLEQLARGAAKLYAASGNFTMLHLLTSAHALRVLMPWLAEVPLGAVGSYWQAFAAGWAASGAQALCDPPLRTWPAIVAQARASDDEHVIKLVDSCREQYRALGGTEWRLAASRAAG